MISFRRAAACAVAIALGGMPLGAQQAVQQKTIDSLAAAVRALQARVDSAAKAPTAAAPAAPTQGRPGAYMNVSFVGLTSAGWSTASDIPMLQRGDHDPHVNGFTVPNAELSLDGTIDPYLKGFVNIVHKLDTSGETGVELEEMYFLTTSLPFNLQLKVGQFFAEFGRQNPQHPHAWSFADQPLVLNRMFGGEGLRSQGARISWLLPTPFYVETMLGVFNSAGGTAYSFNSEESEELTNGQPIIRDVKNAGDLLYVPRIATSFDLTDNQVILLGASGAFGPNSAGETTRTRIVGADAYWKWKSPSAHQGFPFVSLQGEYLARDYETTISTSKIQDDGAYAELMWGIRPRWVAGLRSEISNGGDNPTITVERQDRKRWSPSLTWYPSEFSKVRFQYNYDRRMFDGGIKNDHSVWMQFEFLLGAHAAHKF